MLDTLLWAIVLFVSAIMAAMLAFPVSVGAAMEISKNLFFAFSILSVAFLILGFIQKTIKAIF
ncbi:MAG: DUF1328 domain-containing protein [Candidatus Omnitrophica bacterium]|nr:DUF1328 domain-containing protein [Candidatus Omnitrophota bacterium]